MHTPEQMKAIERIVKQNAIERERPLAPGDCDRCHGSGNSGRCRLCLGTGKAVKRNWSYNWSVSRIAQ